LGERAGYMQILALSRLNLNYLIQLLKVIFLQATWTR